MKNYANCQLRHSIGLHFNVLISCKHLVQFIIIKCAVVVSIVSNFVEENVIFIDKNISENDND